MAIFSHHPFDVGFPSPSEPRWGSPHPLRTLVRWPNLCAGSEFLVICSLLGFCCFLSWELLGKGVLKMSLSPQSCKHSPFSSCAAATQFPPGNWDQLPQRVQWLLSSHFFFFSSGLRSPRWPRGSLSFWFTETITTGWNIAHLMLESSSLLSQDYWIRSRNSSSELLDTIVKKATPISTPWFLIAAMHFGLGREDTIYSPWFKA